jgi:Ala-tRNA(Pro) deacylase
MTMLRKSLHYLDSHRIRYAHTTHSPAYTAEGVAAAEYMPPDRMAKTVVCRDNDGYLMVAVPADSQVDLQQLKTATGLPSLRVAAESDLYMLFPEAELGAMPPLGPLFEIRVYLDRELANRQFIAFNAGTHRDLIHMRTADYQRLVRPVVGDFCQPDYRLTAGLA